MRKHCSGCGETKSIEDFTKCSKAKDGLYYLCKACKKAARPPRAKEDPAKVKERVRRFLEKNPGYAASKYREWAKANPDKVREKKRRYVESSLNAHHCQQRRARIAKLQRTLTQSDWLDSLSFFNNQCAYCSATGGELEREHIIPVTSGGGYVRNNIIPACPCCNQSKSNKPMTEWYRAQSFFNVQAYSLITQWITCPNVMTIN